MCPAVDRLAPIAADYGAACDGCFVRRANNSEAEPEWCAKLQMKDDCTSTSAAGCGQIDGGSKAVLSKFVARSMKIGDRGAAVAVDVAFGSIWALVFPKFGGEGDEVGDGYGTSYRQSDLERTLPLKNKFRG